jgi:hypothetical protein
MWNLYAPCLRMLGMGIPPPLVHIHTTEVVMLLAIAAVLVVLWVLGFVAFHVTAFAIHVLLIAAVVVLVMHFAGTGRRHAHR